MKGALGGDVVMSPPFETFSPRGPVEEVQSSGVRGPVVFPPKGGVLWSRSTSHARGGAKRTVRPPATFGG